MAPSTGRTRTPGGPPSAAPMASAVTCAGSSSGESGRPPIAIAAGVKSSAPDPMSPEVQTRVRALVRAERCARGGRRDRGRTTRQPARRPRRGAEPLGGPIGCDRVRRRRKDGERSEGGVSRFGASARVALMAGSCRRGAPLANNARWSRQLAIVAPLATLRASHQQGCSRTRAEIAPRSPALTLRTCGVMPAEGAMQTEVEAPVTEPLSFRQRDAAIPPGHRPGGNRPGRPRGRADGGCRSFGLRQVNAAGARGRPPGA